MKPSGLAMPQVATTGVGTRPGIIAVMVGMVAGMILGTILGTTIIIRPILSVVAIIVAQRISEQAPSAEMVQPTVAIAEVLQT